MSGIQPVPDDTNGGWDWLARIPFAQLFSLVVVVMFVATGVWALMGWGDVPNGVSPSPVVQAWPTILIAAIGGGILHQGIKLFKGGSTEVDQQ